MLSDSDAFSLFFSSQKELCSLCQIAITRFPGIIIQRSYG